jgi:hypothetical protein
LIVRRPGFPHAAHPNSGQIQHRTAFLADPAADTEIEIYPGELDAPDLSLGVPHRSGFHPDRLLRCGTDLFAHNTRNALVVGQTTIPIDEGEPDAHVLLFRKRKPLNGTGGADLAAEAAGEFTVAKARDQDRAPQTFHASLEEGRLQAISGTDLHALPAPDTTLKEFPLRHGPRGAD